MYNELKSIFNSLGARALYLRVAMARLSNSLPEVIVRDLLLVLSVRQDGIWWGFANKLNQLDMICTQKSYLS
jgi:hypothetical protein